MAKVQSECSHISGHPSLDRSDGNHRERSTRNQHPEVDPSYTHSSHFLATGQYHLQVSIPVVGICRSRCREILPIYSMNSIPIDLLGFASLSSATLCQHQTPPRCLCASLRAPTRTQEASTPYVLHLLPRPLAFTVQLFAVVLQNGPDRDPTFPHRTNRYPRNSPTRAGSGDVTPLFEPFTLKSVHFVRRTSCRPRIRLRYTLS